MNKNVQIRNFRTSSRTSRSPRRPIKFSPLPWKCICIYFFLNPIIAGGISLDEKKLQIEKSAKIPVVTQASTELAAPPFLVTWCEREGCEHFYSDKVICQSEIYENPDPHSLNVGRLVPGEKIRSRVYFTKVLAVGKYTSVEGISKVLVSRASEHSWLSFYDHAWDSETSPADHVTFPITEAWAFIQSQNQRSGFIRMEGKPDRLGARACPFERQKPHSVAAATGGRQD